MSSFSIRLATEADLGAIRDIYNYYVHHSTCTYQIEPETATEREAWFRERSVKYPATVAEARLLLIDNVGMLSQLYRFGRFAYIGGAFGAGLHNTLEAAAFGLPVFFGPRYERFQEAVELVQLGCAFSVESARQLEAAFDRLYYNEEARLKVQDTSLDYVHSHAGATARILKELTVLK